MERDILIPGFVLISTSDALSPRKQELQRLVDSMNAFKLRNPKIPLRLVLLLQRSNGEHSLSFPDWVQLITYGGRVSLSAARNLLLDTALHQNLIGEADIVAFPDDDCWYPDGVLEYIYTRFASQPTLDCWFCRYSSQPSPIGDMVETSPRLQQLIARASSNTIFLRGGVVKSSGHFDVRLGVGAEINGGEDTEYALRVKRIARKILFLDVPAVGHRDPDPRLRPRYFTGSLVAIALHARGILGYWAAFRKVLVGVGLVASQQLAYREFIGALKLVASIRS